MNRRRFLELAAGTSAIIAGCSDGGSDTPTQATPHGNTVSPTKSQSGTPTETESPTKSSNGETNVLIVSPDGSASNPGTVDEPLDSISDAVSRARPGETIEVRSGEYREHVLFKEGGRPGEPITLTGPPDAVLKPGEHQPISIRASHVHITGLTIDGLIDESKPDDPDSYFEHQLIGISPSDPDPRDPYYLEDILISPHRMGNSGSAFINAALLKDSEIGGFEVIGPAGANWLLSDEQHHNGEFVYLGTAPNNLERNQGIEVYDQTRNIRVHHIDNSASYGHSELVDCKIGTRNITVEYCTDGGGAQVQDSYYTSSITLDGQDHTIRWNVIQNAHGDAVSVGPNSLLSAPEEGMSAEPATGLEREMGNGHAIYRNVFTGCTHEAVNFKRESEYPTRPSNPLPRDQRALCRNLFDAYSDGEPGTECPGDLPTTDGVGHLAGDSPWDRTAPRKQAVFERDGQDLHLDFTVHRDTGPTGTDVDIPVTVRNNNDNEDEVELRIRVDESVLSERIVAVPPGGEREVMLSERLPHEEELAVTRNGQKIGSVHLLHEA